MGALEPVFCVKLEEELVKHVKAMEAAMFCLSLTDLRRLAFDIAARADMTHPFDAAKGLAGVDWAKAFLARHADISLRRPIATSLARIRGFNKEAVADFYQKYRDVLTDGDFTAVRTWNCDETGFSVVAKPVKVLGTTGIAQVRKASSAERGQNITALCCMSAGGMFVPPLFVFPRKRMVDPLMHGSPVGYIGTVNVRGSGYIDGSLFLKWMKLFVDTVGCTKENRHLLLLDGHESHKSLEVIFFARDNGVVMLTFPPHCTHRLQPLDRTFFRSLKAGYSRACDNWMTCHKGRPITQFDVIELFTTAYNASATVASATNGFSATGLWPFNDSKFDDELGNNDEAAQFVPVRNPVGDEDDMQAEPVVNDVVQRPISRAITGDSVQAGDTRSASTRTVLAEVHAMPVAVAIGQDVKQPEPISSVTQRARAIAIGVAAGDLDRGRLDNTVQDDDAIVSLPSIQYEQDNQDTFRDLIKACSPKVSATPPKKSRRVNTKRRKVNSDYI